MKSQHRHELQENVLAGGLGSFVAWVKSHANLISWVLLGVAVAVLVGVLWHRHSVRQEAQLQADFSSYVVNSAGDLSADDRLAKMKDLLGRDSNPERQAMTAYEIGREYALRALVAQTGEQKALQDQAAEYYRTVIDKYPQQYQTVAKAHLALAAIQQDRRDFTAAAAEYQAVMNMSNLSAGYPVIEFANQAREMLKDLKEPTKFASTAPSTQPTSASGPASASAPATASAASAVAPVKKASTVPPAATSSAPATGAAK